MTTDVAPAPPSLDSAAPSRGLTFLSKAVKATGYGRVATGALAAGTFNGQRAHLVAPIERIAAADVKVRTGGTKLLVNVTNAHPINALATRAAEGAARACGLESAEVLVTLRLPMRSSTGTDVDEATVLAVIDGIDKACEYGLRPNVRSALIAALLEGRSGGLAAGGPAIVSATGAVLAQAEEPARLLIVMAQPDAGGADARDIDDDATFGTLLAPPTDSTDPATLAAWLVRCSGDAQHPAADALRDAASGMEQVLGVIGGHTPTSPVVALLASHELAAAQKLLMLVPRALPEGWRASVGRTSIG